MKAADFAPLGVLEEQVLVAVLRAGDEAYGMEVRREIERVAGRDVAIGAVYATLDRLESKGLLDSRRVVSESPTRRRFALTRAGAGALAETRAMRDRLWQGVDLRGLAALARG
jgi:PadR family transcriptional regulator PadR